MNINKKENGQELVVTLEGRLDTVSAPVFEQEMSDLSGITSLVLDLKDLEYTSSAGLRVLLALQKKMNQQGKMVLTNVCDSVREVFDITGFSDILTIQ